MNLPSWSLRKATLYDREVAKKANDKSAAKIVFNDRGSLGQWMKGKGWKRSWFFLEDSFIKRLFDNDEDFKLALSEKVIEIFVPKESFRITEKRLEEIDH